MGSVRMVERYHLEMDHRDFQARSIAVTVADTLAGRLRLGVVALEGVSVRESDPELEAEVDRYCAGLRERHGGGPSREVPGVSDARALYKELGLDPTKIRPSNEALLRRALKGQTLYRISTLVDALNLCSLREQLPFGLYDVDRVTPPVTLRLGVPGEGYEGIRKGHVNVEGRPVLVDVEGPFGNPTADSARTMIRLGTRRALVTCYAPAACSAQQMEGVLDRTRDTLVRICGGRQIAREIL
jgi:DNA/RNA-binding domain of Phe-tRNA-synthetase-like protein